MSAPATRTPAPAPATAPVVPSSNSGRLLLVETRRYAARTAVRWVALAMLAVVAVTVFAAYRATVPPTQEQLDRAQLAYQEQLGYWEESGDQQMADCLEQEAAERERNPDQEIDFGCDQMEPTLEWFLPSTSTFADSAAGWLDQVATMLLMLAVVVGATFVAAEFGTGSISTWLTFEPRRGRVFTSKAVVATVLTGVLVVLVAAVAVGGSWAVSAVNDAVGSTTPQLWRDLGGQVGRTGAAGAVAALLGVALAFLLRHTAAAIAVVVGWFIAVEGILSSLVQDVQRWTVRLNLVAWLDDGLTYQTSSCAPGDDGVYTCDFVEHTIAMWPAGAVLLGYTAVVTVAALFVFRRRDVG